MSEDLSASGFLLLESGTLHYKTNAKDRKDAILPLIALVTASGNFLKRHMCAAEGTLWLREILHLRE